MDVLFIDHYDSFSFNLLDRLEQSSRIRILRVPYDNYKLLLHYSQRPLPLVLSPGPHSPLQTPSSIAISRDFLGKAPILGVCLGHQILGAIFGASVKRSIEAFHGSRRVVAISKESKVFPESTLQVGTYNSLTLREEELHPSVSITGRNVWGEVEAMEWHQGEHPCLGVQFHPESFLSEQMSPLFKFWECAVRDFYKFRP